MPYMIAVSLEMSDEPKFFIRFILYRSLRKLILKIKFHTTGKGYRIGQ